MELVEDLKWYHRPYHEKRNGFSTLRTFKTANVLIYALDFFRNQSRAAHSCTVLGVAKRSEFSKLIDFKAIKLSIVSQCPVPILRYVILLLQI